MSEFDAELGAELASLEASGLRRTVRRLDGAQGAEVIVQGRRVHNFSSNDYLGLAGHPEVREAAARGARDWGGGAAASRLICGSLGIHHELEEQLAAFKRTEAALTFANGYMAALGTLGALVGTGDVVIVDKRVHACVVDGARLSGATLRVFRHNDPAHLGDILAWADRSRAGEGCGGLGGRRRRRVLVVTESVFSMDGDRAPLREIVELKDRFGAWLMVDEAHAVGVCGPAGRGRVAEAGLEERVEVQMGTLGKALGAAGGYIAGRRVLVDLLVNRARSFIFSTAPVPAAVAAARCALAIAEGAEGERRRQILWDRVRLWHGSVEAHRVRELVKPDGAVETVAPIVPWLVGGEREAVALFERLFEAGFYVPAVRYPTVARGAARLRVTFTASHSEAQVRALAAQLTKTPARAVSGARLVAVGEASDAVGGRMNTLPAGNGDGAGESSGEDGA